MNKEYTINIIETSEYAFKVKAENKENAIEKAYTGLYQGEGFLEKSYKEYCNSEEKK